MASTPQSASTASAQSVTALPIQPRAEAQVRVMSSRSRNRRIGLTISYIILVLAVIFAVYPVYFALLVAVRPNGQLLTSDLLSLSFRAQCL